jgi:putative oxidoreductase
MQRTIGRYSPQLFALLRIVAGLLFAMHGAQKLFGWPGGKDPMTAPMMMAAGWIELVAGVLIAIGFLTSWLAFLASGEMAVAYFVAHAHPILSWPIINQGELAVLYCLLFLFIAAHGAGIWSVDGARRRAT